MIKKYLHFTAHTLRQTFDLSSIKIDIPIELFENNLLLNCYIKGIIYQIISEYNDFKKLFVKIIDYRLTDIKE